MTTKEAIQAMIDGNRVRTIDWNKDCYVWFNGEMFIDEEEEYFTEFTYYSSTWEIYEEPKPKKTVTIEKWLVKTAFNVGFKIIEASVDYFESHFSDEDKIKLLETYKVEL